MLSFIMKSVALGNSDGGDTAAIIGAVVGVLALLVLSYTLLLSAKSHKVEAFTSILNFLEKNRKDRRLLEKMIADDKNLHIPDCNPYVQAKFEDLAHYYDVVGWLVYEGALSRHFVLTFYSRSLVVGWKSLQSLVNSARVDRRQPGHMYMFQMLAIEAMEHRRKKHPKEKLTFSVKKPELRQWQKWRRTVTGWTGMIYTTGRLFRL